MDSKWPFKFTAGGSGFGLGVGCGVGIGVGKALSLGGIPVVGEAVNGLSIGLGNVPGIRGLMQYSHRCIHASNIPHIGGGLGCGLGIGYGYGIGIVLKHNALEDTYTAVQKFIGDRGWKIPEEKSKMKGIVPEAEMKAQAEDIRNLQRQMNDLQKAFCRLHPDDASCLSVDRSNDSDIRGSS